ncbi:MAG: site-specific integrase [Gemmataceae bacterium]
MQHLTPWSVDPVKILTRRELAAVLDDLEHKSKRSPNAAMNRVLIRLACCAGLRVSEIAALQLDDVRVDSGRPHLRVRPEAAKGGKGRIVPVWWDAGTLADLKAWKRKREQESARPRDPFICCQKPKRKGEPLIRHTIRERFRTACKPLGLERLRHLTIHHGQHTLSTTHSLGPIAGGGQGRCWSQHADHDQRLSAYCGG